MALNSISGKIRRIFSPRRKLIAGIATGVALLIILICNIIVSAASAGLAFDSVTQIPANDYCLVLGCAPRMRNFTPSPAFTRRLDAAARLYRHGKARYIIVSGARRNTDEYDYDEPYEMKEGLIVRGVPDSRIIMDPRGFRTLDSIVRAKKILGLNKFTIVSQHFHNTRAIYIGRHYGLNVVAYNAENSTWLDQINWQLREFFAKVIVMSDLYLFDTQPAVLNDKIKMPELPPVTVTRKP